MTLLGSGDSLEQILSTNGILGSRSPSGWYTLRCPLCRDKKTRGGWKFEGGGGSYHCFNCSSTAGYKPGSRQFSEKMAQVLSEFGILDQCKSLLFSAFASDSPPIISPSVHPDLSEPAVIELPTFFRPLDTQLDGCYVDYLASRRIALNSSEFMVTDKVTGKWAKRLIVISKNPTTQQPTFFQGRDITCNPERKRWESPVYRKTNVIFNLTTSKMFSDVDLIVCEGALDALSVENGIALLGSTFSKYHTHKLKQVRGRKIIVPNKDANGKFMAEQALSAGFTLSFPDIGSCGDLNEALCKYGSMYLETAIAQGVVDSEFAARMKLGHWVKNN